MKMLYIIFIIAMQVDAFQQAIKHTQSRFRTDRKWDHAWHYIYWLLDKPLFAFYGYLVFDYIFKNFIWLADFWHYQPAHFVFVGHLLLGIIGWQLSYRLLWKPYFIQTYPWLKKGELPESPWDELDQWDTWIRMELFQYREDYIELWEEIDPSLHTALYVLFCELFYEEQVSY